MILFYKNKKNIFLFIVIILLIFRMILPQLLLHKANEFLANFSPMYKFHMEDLDISIIRGSYQFENIEGRLKGGNEKVFLKIESIDVSMAWREIFNGKIVTDIIADNVNFLVLKDMSKLSSPKKESEEVKDTLFPVKVESLELKRSKVIFEELPSLVDESRLRIEDINGHIKNLTPTKDNPITTFGLMASLQGQNAFLFNGSMDIEKNPIKFDVDMKLEGFNLKSLNPILKRNLPLTFTKGRLDLYGEVKNSGDKIIGYVKPFFKNIDVVENKEKFIGIKHFVIEIGTAFANLFLRDRDSKTIATYINFNYEKGSFNIDKGLAIEKAIENGFKEKIKPGIDNKYHLDK